MAQILVIDADTVLVDAADIDFGTPGPPPDHPIQAAQFAAVAAAIADPSPIDVAAFSAIAVGILDPVPTRVAAFAMVAVIRGTRHVLSLAHPIGLPCWQPCTAYGHHGVIYYVG
jgi:hypothetical protein